MTPEDWKEAWKAGTTPWDAGSSAPALIELLEREAVPAGRVLVPGCGAGHDLATLARSDREVIGLDLSEEARAKFLAAHPNLPGEVIYEVTDFFSYEPVTGGFDFVWDYTFFCALDPSQRSEWSKRMKRLVGPSRLLATLLFPFEDPLSNREGPPWPVNATMVGGLLGDAFERIELSEPQQTHPGREGRERLGLWRRRAGP
ncbi:MAG: methyltransferase domain-containing protein [Myxococcales bacterium]|jgi:SAM-dependent methyltransferase